MHPAIQQILSLTKKRIQLLKAQPEPCSENKSQFCSFQKRDFAASVAAAKTAGKIPLIAEIKPASPEKKFREVPPDKAAEFAKEMEAAGAVALSVLTEPEIFQGTLENLKRVRKAVSLPVLRKDFLIDESQLGEVESDLVLLIAGLLKVKLPAFVELAQSKGFEPLVEVHTLEELEMALSTPAKIIGINNRDFKTMEIRLETTEKLAPLLRKHDQKKKTSHIIVSESGIYGPKEIKRALFAGADVLLVGSSIMESESLFEKTRELVQSLPAWRW
ncbi:MAG: indole-3-glycerol-phosphate synthase [Methanosarcinaceae archaeon]|nr:indole-3-glycerol-phosphate synthase [Methanosarcinaceae archaeon]MDD4331943.1 indole-3-glycerol-phosphate synthase [Methanosarcinaceae archaeon]MDD4749269.1 indole-3-glycerol-phosphate synthase [Methanosarcinaceae archaeon]